MTFFPQPKRNDVSPSNASEWGESLSSFVKHIHEMVLCVCVCVCVSIAYQFRFILIRNFDSNKVKKQNKKASFTLILSLITQDRLPVA